MYLHHHTSAVRKQERNPALSENLKKAELPAFFEEQQFYLDSKKMNKVSPSLQGKQMTKLVTKNKI